MSARALAGLLGAFAGAWVGTVAGAPLGTPVDVPVGTPLTVPAAAAGAAPAASARRYATVLPGHALEFPRDFGSHPQFRTEWWYVTGWLQTRKGELLGFQITFFRTRPDVDETNPSAFTPHQLLIAHCAVSDPTRGRLWQDQRIRRAGLGLAQAREGDTEVWIDDWRLQRRGADYSARLAADGFALNLTLSATRPPMENGQSGFSRKGPAAESASYYYSIPQMQIAGSLTRAGKTDPVVGTAWFDHEWSSDYLDPGATGWDWIGINLDDGGALMAFRIRGAGGETRWAGGTLERPDGRVRTLDAADIDFTPARRWLSPRTGIAYPVVWHVRAGPETIDLEPLMDDQENDTRLTTGAVYWEGAVRALRGGLPVGRGYLELTGYGERLRIR
ncbi:MAG: lipocalin-like domain-containing protein [Steroidobacteraceae bacterium]